MSIQGIDISHYQGTDIPWDDLWKAGIRFVGIKFSQGTSYKDDAAVTNTIAARSKGFKVFPYHFVTNDNGIDQYNWFIQCVGNLKFDLPAALDCEAFNAVSRLDKRLRKLSGQGEEEVKPILDFRTYPYEPRSLYANERAYEFPTQAVVDVIARRLKGFQGWSVPAIYTNVYSGNKIFTSPLMAQYLLWVANWGVNVPNLPKVWKDANQTPYIWQDGVVNNLPINPVDHDVWMNKFPFPDTPAPPAQETADVEITIFRGQDKFSGKVTLPKVV